MKEKCPGLFLTRKPLSSRRRCHLRARSAGVNSEGLLALVSVILIATLVAQLLSPSLVRAQGAGTSFASASDANDPWYSDMAGHWARPYIRVLWEEQVADGYVYSGVSYFRPDRLCNRSQFLLLLAKVFQIDPFEPAVPSYTDAGPSLRILEGKRAWPYIEACVLAGISFVPPGGNLFPYAAVTREDAVEFLVRCLDLWPVAQAISEDEARRILSRFPDGNKTSPGRVKSMALSVRLGIVQGCGDGTLQPGRSMMRCEMGTIVYKSCLVRADASPVQFSPDGDGIDETVELRFTWLKNRNIEAWNGGITDTAGKVILPFNAAQTPGSPPRTLEWDGRDSSGRSLPEGQYFYQIWVKDRLGNQFFSIKKPVYLVRHSLSARLTPQVAADGDIVSVLAETRPAAVEVTATFASGSTVPLKATPDHLSWTGGVEMGPDFPLGEQVVRVRAIFAGALREETLYLTRLDPLTLTAEVRPNPASRGQSVSLVAYTGRGVQAVTATLFGETVELHAVRETSWEGEYRVPVAAPAGFTDVLFTAFADGRRKDHTVILSIEESPLTNLTFVLSE